MADPIDPTSPAATGAKAAIAQTLKDWGLPASLVDTLWNTWYVGEGRPITQILLDLRQTPEFRTRFPGIAMLEDRRNRGEAVYIPDVGEYVQLESGIASLLKDAGLPSGFYDDPSDYGKFIGGATSPKEVENRINLARDVAFSVPVQVREELDRVYGIEPGELVAYFLDPNKAMPALTQKVAAAQVGGAAKRSGFGLLTRAEMEQLAGAGTTEAAAGERFGQLVELAPLFTETAEESQDLGRAEQLGFAGGEATDVVAIERRRKARQARFAGGGGAAGIGGQGSGLGSAQ